MKIDIYRSSEDKSHFVSVPEGTDIEKIILPKKYENISKFNSINIEKDHDAIALDVNDILMQIKQNGYALHTAEIDITYAK